MICFNCHDELVCSGRGVFLWFCRAQRFDFFLEVEFGFSLHSWLMEEKCEDWRLNVLRFGFFDVCVWVYFSDELFSVEISSSSFLYEAIQSGRTFFTTNSHLALFFFSFSFLFFFLIRLLLLLSLLLSPSIHLLSSSHHEPTTTDCNLLHVKTIKSFTNKRIDPRFHTFIPQRVLRAWHPSSGRRRTTPPGCAVGTPTTGSRTTAPAGLCANRQDERPSEKTSSTTLSRGVSQVGNPAQRPPADGSFESRLTLSSYSRAWFYSFVAGSFGFRFDRRSLCWCFDIRLISILYRRKLWFRRWPLLTPTQRPLFLPCMIRILLQRTF